MHLRMATMQCSEFRAVRNRYKLAVRNWQRHREYRVLTSGNSNALYKYAKSRKNYCEAIAPLCDAGGTLRTSNIDKCNILATYYGSVFSHDNQLQYALPLATNKKLAVIVLDPVDVYDILRKLPPKVSMGPDGIPPCVLRYCAVSLALPYSILYNMSLSSGIVPAA